MSMGSERARARTRPPQPVGITHSRLLRETAHPDLAVTGDKPLHVPVLHPWVYKSKHTSVRIVAAGTCSPVKGSLCVVGHCLPVATDRPIVLIERT